MAAGSTSEPWHLDRRIPIATIFTLLVQTALVAWAVSAINSQVQENTRANVRQDAIIDAIRADVQVKADRVAETQRVLSEQIVEQRGDLRAIRELMARIERQMDEKPATWTPRAPP